MFENKNVNIRSHFFQKFYSFSSLYSNPNRILDMSISLQKNRKFLLTKLKFSAELQRALHIKPILKGKTAEKTLIELSL